MKFRVKYLVMTLKKNMPFGYPENRVDFYFRSVRRRTNDGVYCKNKW